MEKFDLVVIGAGPGGYPAAIRAAQAGASVALVDRDGLGGACLNRGCIPTKMLIASADLYRRVAASAELGVSAGERKFDYAAMAARKNGVVAKLRSGVASLLKSNGVKTIEGEAAFISAREIIVTSDGNDATVPAGRFIIATGSEPVVPGGIEIGGAVHTSATFLELDAMPASLIIVGGGYIGCEFACLAAALGSTVTVVEALQDVLPQLDRDIRMTLKRSMEADGVRFMTGAAVEDVKAASGGVTATAAGEALEAEAMLVACGRRPVTDGLDLDSVGIGTGRGGRIEVDEFCRTRAPGIYAVGDVTGGVMLAHNATSQGLIAAANACGAPSTKAETVIPACIFTMPEVATVGVSELDAKARGVEIAKAKFSFAASGRAMAAGEAEGFVKLIADAKTGRLIGAQCVGSHATELIAEAALAVRSELTAAELSHTIHCHPTLSEAWMEAAHMLAGEPLHSPPGRKPAPKGS